VSPAGFITPCLSTKASTPPSGGLWVHEINGFRVIARKDGARVRWRHDASVFLYAFDLIDLVAAALVRGVTTWKA
jgi:hypothetical protein